MNRSPRLAALAAGCTLAAGVCLLITGCPKPPPALPKGITTDTTAKGDPWETAARALRQNTDAAACKDAISQLNNDLAAQSDAAAVAAITPEALKRLAEVVPLNATDLEEVKATAYTNLDPIYLADCFYLRDVNRSLDLSGLPPEKAADLGFAWVCRQVYVSPWQLAVAEGRSFTAIVPPVQALRRGSGSGVDRAYVFLALLQQMGLDACLVGPPDAGEKKVSPLFATDAKTPPRGPFWAVGVRTGADVRLYEPWRGVPFPGTLAQVKANPGLLKPWNEDKADPWGIAADEVRKATVFLTVPVSSLSPRMKVLEEKLKGETGLRLATDPAALRERFSAAAPAGPGLATSDVKFWNPPGERFAYGRILPAFLPLTEGGLDRDPEGNRLYDRYYRSQVPVEVIGFPPILSEREPQERLRSAALAAFAGSFLTPPTPRERLQRGQFQDAARYLSDQQDSFRRGLDRLRLADIDAVVEWCKAANEAYAELGRARLDGDPGRAGDAQARVDELWKVRGDLARVIVDKASAEVGLAEATFLLALVKHEEAERLQARAERAGGADAAGAKAEAVRAWQQAAVLWKAYAQQQETQVGYPGRAAHVKALSDRADALAK